MINRNSGFFKLVSTLALASVLSLAGCGGGGGNSSGNTPTPSTGNSGGNTSTATTGGVKFINNSTHLIDTVYVTPTTSTTWGSILNSSPIAVGSSLTLPGFAIGMYDARVGSIGTSSTYYAYGSSFQVLAGFNYVLTPVDSNFSGSLNITNNSVFPITALYISPSAYGAGSNQITTSIATGSTFQIRGIPSGGYFVEAVINGNKNDAMTSISSYSTTPISY